MRFEAHQDFVGSPADVIDLYCDQAFYPRLDGLGKLGSPEVVDRESSSDRVRMQVRFRFVAELPSAALAVVNPDRLTWVEDTTYDFRTATSATVIRPDHYHDRLSATAMSRFSSSGQGCARTIEGDLRVRALLVAGQVERAIISGMREHLVLEAEVLNSLLG